MKPLPLALIIILAAAIVGGCIPLATPYTALLLAAWR